MNRNLLRKSIAISALLACFAASSFGGTYSIKGFGGFCFINRGYLTDEQYDDQYQDWIEPDGKTYGYAVKAFDSLQSNTAFIEPITEWAVTFSPSGANDRRPDTAYLRLAVEYRIEGPSGLGWLSNPTNNQVITQLFTGSTWQPLGDITVAFEWTNSEALPGQQDIATFDAPSLRMNVKQLAGQYGVVGLRYRVLGVSTTP